MDKMPQRKESMDKNNSVQMNYTLWEKDSEVGWFYFKKGPFKYQKCNPVHFIGDWFDGDEDP